MKITDMALASSFIRTEGEHVKTFFFPDRTFVDVLNSFKKEDLVSGKINYNESYTRIYESLLKGLRETRRLEEYENVQITPFDAIEVIKRFVIHKISIPLIEERLGTKHYAFGTYEGYLNLFKKQEIPFFAAHHNGLFMHRIPEYVHRSWEEYTLIGEYLRQIIENEEIIRCPKANRLIPGLAQKNLAFEGNCANWITRGCGEWFEGDSMMLPKCNFSMHLDKFSFR